MPLAAHWVEVLHVASWSTAAPAPAAVLCWNSRVAAVTLCSYCWMVGVSGMGVAEERVMAALRRLREQGVAECCGLEIAREVRSDREEPVVVGYAFYRALGELVKSGRLESRWGSCCADEYGRSCYRLAGDGG